MRDHWDCQEQMAVMAHKVTLVFLVASLGDLATLDFGYVCRTIIRKDVMLLFRPEIKNTKTLQHFINFAPYITFVILISWQS